MVLSAINFKLSSSSRDRVERRRTLDAFSCIITKARKAYDITDSFSDGINRILYLAYAITKEIFISAFHTTAAGMIDWAEAPNSPAGSWQSPGSQTQQSLTGHKARTWVEGFLKFPRAYLRISATVDYAMCHGVLPNDDSLHPMLRQVTTIVFQNASVPQTMTELPKQYVVFMPDHWTAT